MKTTILLADDHQLMREGLRRLIEGQSGLQVVAEAADGRAAVALAARHRPDVVVIDVSMPDVNGIEATAQMLAHDGSLRVLALSMHADREHVVGMLKAGARGYVLKDAAFDELIRAIAEVMRGNIYLSPRVAGSVVDAVVASSSESPPDAGLLSARETEVLRLLAVGRSAKEIGRALHISARTVETHRRNIMTKVNVASVAELIKYAIRNGLTSLGE